MPLRNHPKYGGPAFVSEEGIVRLLVFALALFLATSTALGQMARRGSIQGNGVAVDGDTIKVGRFSIRLVGIDAPEISQNCQDRKGRKYPCGKKAKFRLQSLMKKGSLYCQRRGGDGMGRELAECWVLGKNRSITNLNEVMVMSGWALAFTKYSEEYTALEALAKKHKAGVWSGKFEFPWQYREKKKSVTATTGLGLLMPQKASKDCPARAPYCKNIRSCSRACFLLQCGFSRLDRDRDGIPCENVCRRRCP